MKTKFVLLALILSIGLFTASCDKDDNEGETVAPIEGKWKLSKVGTVSGSTETLVDAPQNASGCDNDYLNLRIDNTAETVDYDSTISPCAMTTRTGTFSRSNNNLTIVIAGVTTTYDIANLTLSELKLKEGNNITVYIR